MDQHKAGWQDFLQCCLKQKNPDELAKLLGFYLTIEEKENVIDRYLLTSALLEGKLTQREISKQLHVSIAKITRGSNALKIVDNKLKSNLQK